MNNQGSAPKAGSRHLGASKFVDLRTRGRAVPDFQCPRCGGQAITEPAVTSTRAGASSTYYPVTCKSCKETVTNKHGKVRERFLRVEVPVDQAAAQVSHRPIKPKETPLPRYTITPEDRKLIYAVNDARHTRGLTWSQMGTEINISYVTLGNAVRKPEDYFTDGVRKKLQAWADQQKPKAFEGPLQTHVLEEPDATVFGVPIVATEAVGPDESQVVDLDEFNIMPQSWLCQDCQQSNDDGPQVPETDPVDILRRPNESLEAACSALIEQNDANTMRAACYRQLASALLAKVGQDAVDKAIAQHEDMPVSVSVYVRLSLKASEVAEAASGASGVAS